MLAVVLALFGAVHSPAQADREDQLEQQEETLSGQIEQQHSELEHSSVELQRTSASLGLLGDTLRSFPFPRPVGRVFRYNEFVQVATVPTATA